MRRVTTSKMGSNGSLTLNQRIHLATSAMMVLLLGVWEVATAQSTVNQSSTRGGVIEEIFVTAERREASLQDTAIAISAMTGTELESWNIQNVDDFATFVPGLWIGNTVGAMQVSLRGVSNDNFFLPGDSPVAFNVDGVFRGRQTGGNFAFFDTERVEVLKGPQGTLYGRNATAGAINVITNKPTSDFEGFFELEAGDYSLFGARGVLNIPLVDDTFAVRVGFVRRERDGYFNNGPLLNENYSDVDESGLRVHGLYTPNDKLSVLVTASGEERGGTGEGTQTLSGGDAILTDIEEPYTAFLNTQGVRDDSFRTYSTEVNYNFDNATLTYVGAYLDTSVSVLADFDGGDVFEDLLQVWVASQQWSHEMRLASSGENRVDWLIGGFHFDEEAQRLNDNFITRPNGDIFNPSTDTPEFNVVSKAVFGQTTLNLTDSVGITAGLRYTIDEKSEFSISRRALNFGAPVVVSEGYEDDWSSFDWLLGMNWYPVPETLAYAKVSTGYKSGGFNSVFAVVTDGISFAPEEILAYQIGHKSQFASNAVQINSELFYYDYTDLQVQQLLDNTSYVRNAASATIWGVDSDIIWAVTEEFRVDFGVSYLDARYDDYSDVDPFSREFVSLSDSRMAKAPEWSGRLGLQYMANAKDWMIVPRVSFSWASDTKLTPFNDLGRLQESWTRTDLSLDIVSPSGEWLTQLFLNNLEDEMVWTNGRLSGSGVRQMNGRPPRMYGVRVRYGFGE